MSWNRYGDWQDSWKDGSQQGGRGWFEHPSDADCTAQFDAYGTWQGNGGAGGWPPGDCGNGMTSGVGVNQGMFGGEHDPQDATGMMGDQSFEAHHGHHMGVNGPHHGNGVHIGAGGNSISSFGSGLGNHHSYPAAASQQIYGATPHTINGHGHGGPPGGGTVTNGHSVGHGGSSNGHAAAAASHNRGAGTNGHGGAQAGDEGEDDRAMIAELEESMRSMMPTLGGHDSSDEDDGPTRPAEATAEERAEAEQVVRTAFKEAKERDKLREKVKKASQADLQALLNARLKR